jgi:hypothetical protein
MTTTGYQVRWDLGGWLTPLCHPATTQHYLFSISFFSSFFFFLAKWMRQKFQHSRKLTQAVWKEVSVSRMGGSDEWDLGGWLTPLCHPATTQHYLFSISFFSSFFFPFCRKLTQAVWKEVSVSRMGGSDDAESDGVRLKEKTSPKRAIGSTKEPDRA